MKAILRNLFEKFFPKPKIETFAEPAPVAPPARPARATVPRLPCPRRLRRQLWRRTYDNSGWEKVFRNRSPFDWRQFAGLPQRRTNSPSTF